MIGPDIQMWMTFGVIFVTIALFMVDRIRLEVVALGALVALMAIFEFWPLFDGDGNSLLDPRHLLAGFADPALVTVLALLIVGQGLIHTGAMDKIGDIIVKRGVRAPRITAIATLLFVMVVSGFMNNTPVVVIFIPILSVLAVRMDRPVSGLMMPLSFAAILGGNLTIIGSSTNMLVSGTQEAMTGVGIGFFDITAMGLMLGLVGLAYLLFVAPFLLRPREGMQQSLVGKSGKQFIVQIEVTEDSSLNGTRAKAGIFPGLENLTLRMIQHNNEALLPPYDNITLSPGDVLVVAATRDALTNLLKKSPDVFHGFVDEHSHDEIDAFEFLEGQQMVAEVVVAPASPMHGRSLSQIGFHSETHCVVLGIERRSRMVRASLNDVRLEAGDVLLVIGPRRDVLNLRTRRDVILLEWSTSDVPLTDRSVRALAIFTAVIGLAASGLLPIVMAAVAGAGAMIMAGCLHFQQAMRSVDTRIIMIVGVSLAMGMAMNATGGATFVAEEMLMALQGAAPIMVLSAFFALVAIFTNLLSNNATAVLFTPIAVSVATSLGVSPVPFVAAVIFAANCSFATPMGYQTNLLVLGPGHYKFSDFIRVGLPLVFIIWAAFTALAPLYYGL